MKHDREREVGEIGRGRNVEGEQEKCRWEMQRGEMRKGERGRGHSSCYYVFVIYNLKEVWVFLENWGRGAYMSF